MIQSFLLDVGELTVGVESYGFVGPTKGCCLPACLPAGLPGSDPGHCGSKAATVAVQQRPLL